MENIFHQNVLKVIQMIQKVMKSEVVGNGVKRSNTNGLKKKC